MKKLFLIFCLSLLLAFIPNANAETVTETRHLGDIWLYTINGNSYSLTAKENLTAYDVYGNVTRNIGGSYDGNIKIGVRVYQYAYSLDYDIIEFNQELTNNSVQQIGGELDNEYEGYVSGNVSITGMNTTRLDGLMVGFYARAKQSDTVWSAWTNLIYPDSNSFFVSESLTYDEIVSSNWNFTVYVKNLRVYTTIWTRKVNICFGNSTYDSRISNIQLADSVTQETEQYMTLAILGLACGVIALGVMVVFKK